MRIWIAILLVIPVSLFCQQAGARADTSEVAKKFKVNVPTDTGKTLVQPLLQLKIWLGTSQAKLEFENYINQLKHRVDAGEENLSGILSQKEMEGYLKNKALLKRILEDKYEGAWWHKIKGIDELLGIPREVIQILQFGLLLL